MIEEEWGQPSVLYLCPIKALLNNLEARLTLLAGMVGRTVAIWHGDVGAGARKRILRARPDILLATPESIEVMLVSRLVDHRNFFASLRAVVVDEVHAFAGDDRGWHLLSLLERVSRLAEHPVQRIALSATLANPEDLLSWLCAGRDVPRRVVRGAAAAAVDSEVTIDWVGSLENAAIVIARLHQGEKRLVFCDSRRQVEDLAQMLRGYRVRTFVSHSSLSADERRQAEQAFSQGSDCVIVATSTLELGIDVGDLDRVIQIDAPSTVAGFLQRLGRSGRRAGTRRNCLFLTTSTDALLRACGIVHLWSNGFVEPVRPPALPYPVLLQQILATLLQEGDRGVGPAELQVRLHACCAAAGIPPADFEALLRHLLAIDVLAADGPVLGFGREGEARYGAKHYLELFSVFNTPDVISVLHGVREIGQVHPLSFQRKESPIHLSLAGHGWKVTHVDWARRRAWAEPTERPGKSRWVGQGPPVHFEMAQAIEGVLRDGLPPHLLSRRASDAVAELRDQFGWLRLGESPLVVETGLSRVRWWNFAGDLYNAVITERLGQAGLQASTDGLAVTVGVTSSVPAAVEGILAAIETARLDTRAGNLEIPVRESVAAMKFADGVPPDLLARLASARFSPTRKAAEHVSRARIPIRVPG
jgi:ATP-dependent Lhr-like helicase